MATEEKSFSSNPAHPPGFSRQGNCYTHSPLFFPTMPWAMRYKTRPPAPRVKVDAHTCVLLLFRSCVECGIGTIPSRNAGDRMPRMGIFTDPLTYRFILYKQLLGFARNQGWAGGKRNRASPRATSAQRCLSQNGDGGGVLYFKSLLHPQPTVLSHVHVHVHVHALRLKKRFKT